MKGGISFNVYVTSKHMLIIYVQYCYRNYEKYYKQAQRVRRLICEDFEKVYKYVS